MIAAVRESGGMLVGFKTSRHCASEFTPAPLGPKLMPNDVSSSVFAQCEGVRERTFPTKVERRDKWR
jgi:hypothetical protein